MLLPAFILGISGSLHCLGMCGPLVISFQFPAKDASQKALYGIAYHSGRILTYSLLGVLLGGLSSVFSLIGFQQGFTITIGVLMLLFLLFPRLSQHFTLLQKIYQKLIVPIRGKIAYLFAHKTYPSTFLMGIFNGFLPCGLVSVALAGALASGSWLTGGLFMTFFGLGTTPMLFALGFSQHLIPENFRHRIQQYAPVMVGALAILLILRGLDLGIPFISPHFSEGMGGKIISSCCHK